MAHTHEHHHHHASAADASLKNVYIIAIVLNLGFVAVEAIVGLICNSLGLISDAGHNLSDVLSLILALVAFKLATSKSNGRFTYGYRKSSVLISLLNAVILLVAVGAIVMESIEKFSSPAAINGAAVSWTAGIGILINGFTAWMLMKRQKHDINTKGAYLHMLADTLVSVGVLVSGIVISFTGWNFIDPVISLVIAGVILVSTWNLLSESIKMSIDAAPEGIDVNELKESMETVEGVTEVHHIHVWPISTTETALTAHIVMPDVAKCEEINARLRTMLVEKGIRHSTLEAESGGCKSESNC